MFYSSLVIIITMLLVLSTCTVNFGVYAHPHPGHLYTTFIPDRGGGGGVEGGGDIYSKFTQTFGAYHSTTFVQHACMLQMCHCTCICIHPGEMKIPIILIIQQQHKPPSTRQWYKLRGEHIHRYKSPLCKTLVLTKGGGGRLLQDGLILRILRY